MTRRITGAEARELAAKATPGPWERIIRRSVADVIVWAPSAPMEGMGTPIVANCEYRREDAALMAAAPDLAESLAAVEAERDALWNALGDVLAAEEALREYDRPDNPTTPMHALAYVEARAPYVGKVREAWQALAALREAAK